MNYSAIKICDIADGPGVRVSLFVSGCRNHCKGCFQPETWDFNYGNPYTAETEREILSLLKPYYIDGLTVLAEAMLRLEAAGFPIVFTVHDEIITEMPTGSRWEDQAEIMGQPVSWAPGLDRYLHADGYETPFYMKD